MCFVLGVFMCCLSLLCLGGAHQGLAPLAHTPVLNHWFSGSWALFKRAVLCYSSLDRWLVCIYPRPVPINLSVVIRYCKVSKIWWSLIIHEHTCLHFPTLTERLHAETGNAIKSNYCIQNHVSESVRSKCNNFSFSEFVNRKRSSRPSWPLCSVL